MSSDSVYSMGPAAGRPTSQIQCGASPCPNFTTRPSSSEPWITHGCCQRHTICDIRHTCAVCDSWSEEVWVGFDSWMAKRIRRSERDAANRARKAKARRERSRPPRQYEPLGPPADRGRASTRRAATTASAVNIAFAVGTAIVGSAGNAVTSLTTASAGSTADGGTASVPDQQRACLLLFWGMTPLGRRSSVKLLFLVGKRGGGAQEWYL